MAYDLEFDAGTITSMVSTGDEVEASLVNSFGKAEDALNDLDSRTQSNTDNITVLEAATEGLLRATTVTISLGVSPDTLTDGGIYEVDTDLPAGITLGKLITTESFEETNPIITQQLSHDGGYDVYERVWTGTLWTSWQETPVTTELRTLRDRVTALEELNLYEFSKVQGVSTTDNTYSPLNALTVTSAPAGIYALSFTLLYTYDTTNKSAYFRMSSDGGTTWVEVRREAKDITDVLTGDFSYPYQHNGGDIELVVEYKTETTGDVLNVLGSNLVVERKK